LKRRAAALLFFVVFADDAHLFGAYLRQSAFFFAAQAQFPRLAP